MTRAVILLCLVVSSLVTLAQTPQWVASKVDSFDHSNNFPVVSIESAVVTEGDNNGCYIVLLLSLSKRSKDPVKVQFQTMSNADEDEDYLQKKGTLTFPANRLLQTVRMPVDCDIHLKLNKTFVVKLSGAVNAILDNVSATGTINSAPAITGISHNKTFN